MQAFLEMIRTAVTTGGIQKSELAEEAGVHRNSLSGIEGDWNPRVKTLDALCKAVERIKEKRA